MKDCSFFSLVPEGQTKVAQGEAPGKADRKRLSAPEGRAKIVTIDRFTPAP